MIDIIDTINDALARNDNHPHAAANMILLDMHRKGEPLPIPDELDEVVDTLEGNQQLTCAALACLANAYRLGRNQGYWEGSESAGKPPKF